MITQQELKSLAEKAGLNLQGAGTMPTTNNEGYWCECPGRHLHTTNEKENECHVGLNDQNYIVLYCFHSSCDMERKRVVGEMVAEMKKNRLQARLKVKEKTCDTDEESESAPEPARESRKQSKKVVFTSSLPLPDRRGGVTDFLSHCFEGTDLINIVAESGSEAKGYGRTETVASWMGEFGWTNDACDHDGTQGVYFMINPPKHQLGVCTEKRKDKEGRTYDAEASRWQQNLASYRYVLVEIDQGTMEQQWAKFQELDLPAVAYYTSGGKSIHALVVVDAKDMFEYHDIVDQAFTILYQHGVDPSTTRPNRMSRLPGFLRKDKGKEQMLLQLNDTKGRTLLQWIAERKFKLQSLMDCEPQPENAPDEIIKDRFLVKKKAALLLGPTGIGKSTVSYQEAAGICLGRDVLGIRNVPRRNRVLVIQAEDDTSDLAQVRDGILHYFTATDDERAWIKDNLILTHVAAGKGFFRDVSTLCAALRPDVILLNPLLEYVDCDPNDNSKVGEWIRQMNDVLESSNVALLVVHYTGKPRADGKATDLSYVGLGASRWSNWVRGIIVLQKTTRRDTLKVCVPKRGSQLKLGTEEKYIRHAPSGHGWYWVEASADERGTEVNLKPREADVLNHVPFHHKDAVSAAQIAEKLKVDKRTVERVFSAFKNTGELLKCDGGIYRAKVRATVVTAVVADFLRKIADGPGWSKTAVSNHFGRAGMRQIVDEVLETLKKQGFVTFTKRGYWCRTPQTVSFFNYKVEEGIGGNVEQDVVLFPKGQEDDKTPEEPQEPPKKKSKKQKRAKKQVDADVKQEQAEKNG